MKTYIYIVTFYCLFFNAAKLAAQEIKTDSVTNDNSVIPESSQEKTKSLQFSVAISMDASNFLEVNANPGPDKKNYSGTGSLDLGLNYKKEGKHFEMTNEAHWLVNVQKDGLSDTSHIQMVSDDLRTLHDFSVGITKGNKLNINLIAKASTSVFTIYDGGYFEDVSHNGKTQAFLSPYEVILSPGIKVQPDNFLRVSVSPFSVSLYGVENQKIANTGLYTHDSDVNHNYVRFVYRQLGAEVNIWYDRQLGKWLELQYRVSISSDYFDKIGKNGLLDGLFITKIRLLKDLYITHRAELKGDFAAKPFKPYYAQTIQLSFTKSF